MNQGTCIIAVMELAAHLILLGSLLVLLGILGSTLSPRLGMPLLLILLAIGMLAGEDGPGGIHYNDVQSAYLIGTLALAVILFDGGLRTDVRNFRVGLRPAVLLASVGVALTAAICGLFATWVLGLSWLEGMLVGAIVGSTDAAAVFSVLNNRGLSLKSRVGSTLEIESGINDPAAIFITVALIGAITAGVGASGWTLAGVFVWQMGGGALFGYAGGRLLAYAITRLTLSPGLYPLLALFGGLFVYALAAELQTSGFVAVYVAGLMVGNRVSRGLYNIQRFNDGVAWLAQIALFLMLGLLVTPSELLPYAPGALLVGLALMFVARPLAVWACLAPFRFAWREQLFIGWVGLRGAVPIVLAMFPWAAGLEQWHLFFNIAFFIVLLSLMAQGWTVVPLARWLKLNIPSGSTRVQRTELGIPGQVEYEIVGYKLEQGSPVLDRALETLAMPRGTRVFCIIRGGQLLSLDADATLRAGDMVYVLGRPGDLPALDNQFVGTDVDRADERAFFGEFVLYPLARLEDLGALYGFEVPEEHRRWSIQRYIHNRHPRPVVGDRVRLGGVEFVVRTMDGARITGVGLKLPRR